MIVVVAAPVIDAPSVSHELRLRGATDVRQRLAGRDRVLLYGAPFDDRSALRVAAELRGRGWPADVRPEAGGHLTAWQDHTQPVIVAERLWVCFPWSEFDREEADLLVEIDPGQAFGTGAHPTTKLLLAELVTRLQGGEHVLDVGCGSGVLAIAAARLGAAQVVAIDIDPKAVAATRANAERNHVAELVEAQVTRVEDLTARFDVVVANIQAEALIHLAPAIQRCLKPGGWLGLGGLSPAQLSKVRAAYQEVQLTSEPTDEDWAALVATTPAINEEA